MSASASGSSLPSEVRIRFADDRAQHLTFRARACPAQPTPWSAVAQSCSSSWNLHAIHGIDRPWPMGPMHGYSPFACTEWSKNAQACRPTAVHDSNKRRPVSVSLCLVGHCRLVSCRRCVCCILRRHHLGSTSAARSTETRGGDGRRHGSKPQVYNLVTWQLGALPSAAGMDSMRAFE